MKSKNSVYHGDTESTKYHGEENAEKRNTEYGPQMDTDKHRWEEKRKRDIRSARTYAAKSNLNLYLSVCIYVHLWPVFCIRILHSPCHSVISVSPWSVFTQCTVCVRTSGSGCSAKLESCAARAFAQAASNSAQAAASSPQRSATLFTPK